MKALLVRSLLVAILVGPAIDVVRIIVLFRRATKYDPPISEAEFRQMGNMTVNEMDAVFAKRRIKMSRWDWLRESVRYSYFWKEVARDAIVPTIGVFLACIWVGWMEKRRAPAAPPPHYRRVGQPAGALNHTAPHPSHA